MDKKIIITTFLLLSISLFISIFFFDKYNKQPFIFMIRIDNSTGTVELWVEKHRPTYVQTRLEIIRSIDSSTVYTTNDVTEDEFYFRAPLDSSLLSEAQYEYHIMNPSTKKVYEQGLIYRVKNTTNNNNDVIYNGLE